MAAARGLSNINFNRRLNQFLILIAIMLVGLLISSSLQAQSYHQSKAKHFKGKFKKQIRQNDRVCTILAKKRTQEPKQSMFAFLKGKPKYKPQAEVDAPSYVRKNNKQVLTAQVTKNRNEAVRE
jgi:hypothetical protein